jgi:hypothetical protein
MYGTESSWREEIADMSQNFRNAVDAKYAAARIRNAKRWNDQEQAMRSCLEAYPTPLDAWERDY